MKPYRCVNGKVRVDIREMFPADAKKKLEKPLAAVPPAVPGGAGFERKETRPAPIIMGRDVFSISRIYRLSCSISSICCATSNRGTLCVSWNSTNFRAYRSPIT